jgi:hypothetical protein
MRSILTVILGGVIGGPLGIWVWADVDRMERLDGFAFMLFIVFLVTIAIAYIVHPWEDFE